jgi:hypothetical protein
LRTPRVVALALDCLTENFAEDVPKGELARLAGVDRYHFLRFAACPSLSFVVLTLGSADRMIQRVAVVRTPVVQSRRLG